MTSLSVIIPAYNEESGIESIVKRVLAIEPSLQEVGVESFELIVVDDGSSDATATLAGAYPGVRLIRHAKNAGYGAALKTGFAAAQGEWIGFLDADETYPPESFADMITTAYATEADIVIGSRMSGRESKMPLVRRLGNFIFAKLVSLISAQAITDSASGMRIFKRSILPQLYPLPDGLNLTPVMSTRALHERLLMVEMPIAYSERKGRSKLSVVRDGMRFAQSIVWTALYYNPVRPLGLVGATALALAALVGMGLVAARLSGVNTIDSFGAFTLFTALILAVGGVSVLALGTSFNYFVALFHKSPVRQGLFGKPLFHIRFDHHFGWIGLVSFLVGTLLGLGSLFLAMMGWTVSELWLYYLTSACLSLIGMQLMIAWIQMQILDTLRIREQLIAEDMQGKEHAAPESVGRDALHTKTA